MTEGQSGQAASKVEASSGNRFAQSQTCWQVRAGRYHTIRKIHEFVLPDLLPLS